MNRREVVREQLARKFTAYSNPARHLLLGMRRASILHGLGPAEVMEHWLEGRQVPGMHRIPAPIIDQRSKATFMRLRAERDFIPVVPYDNRYDLTDPAACEVMQTSWTRKHIWCAMHATVIQMVDPWWKGTKFIDVVLPNQIDWELVSDCSGEFHRANYETGDNLSYHIATAHETRIPDYSGPRRMVPDTVRSSLAQEMLDRKMAVSLGFRLSEIITELVEDNIEPGMRHEARRDLILDLADMGMLDLPTFLEYEDRQVAALSP